MRTITTKVRCLAAICLSFMIALSVHAQQSVPLKMSYQAVVRDGANKLLENKVIGMRISIRQGSANGYLAYRETHTPTTNANGLVSIIIGEGQPSSGTVAQIDWSQGPYFAETEIDPTGGKNYTITSTTQLLSVPFALYAEKAGNGFDGKYESLSGVPTLSRVAETGSYNDLEDKPEFEFADVATSGEYEDLVNKPEFAEVATSGAYEDLVGKPKFADVATSGAYEDLAGKPKFADVATSGNYNTLNNLPDLKKVATSGSYKDLKDTLDFAKVAVSGQYKDLSGTPELAEVATTGSYKNLIDTPKNISELTNDAHYIVNEKQKLKLEGSNLSIMDETGENTINTVVLPSSSTGGVTDYEQLTNKPEGTKNGDLLYWNSSEKKWNILGMGLEGQILSISNGQLSWTEPSFIINTEAYNEGEVFYKSGQVEGIIIKSDPMTRSGLLLSLNESTTKWGEKEYAAAIDSTNGTSNMSAIAGMTNWESNYPAFSYARTAGDSWYLPSTEELKLILQNVDKINEELATVTGGTPLSQDFYWASTERDLNNAYGVSSKDVSIKDPDSPIHANEKYIITETVKSSTGKDSLVFVSLDIPKGERIYAPKDTKLGVRAIRKLSWSELTSKPVSQGSYKVGDIYYDAHKTIPLGIVYQVTQNGAHGKVLSIKECNAENTKTWAEAGEWVRSELSPNWVIPTAKEWKDIAALKTTLNTILVKNNYPSLNMTAPYWSSTEDGADKAIIINMPASPAEGGSTIIEGFEEESSLKTNSALVRAILEF
ncbi:hypothetical protein [Bacteroides sp.]